MYGQFFNIDESAFSIAPNPKYLFLSKQHEEALAHLLYGVNRKGGFVCLTGDIGTGKTTICRCMFEQLPENTDIAIIINPKISPVELLASICDELGINSIEIQPSIKVYIKKLHEYLIKSHAKGRNTVLVVDEAQNLSADALEHIRSLTNLETNEEKLLQIILIGQPELKALLAKPELEQVNQRITARFHIGPLSLAETIHYIHHRLAVAGAKHKVFTDSNIKQIYTKSKGVPRLINILCDRVLLGAYTLGTARITSKIITQSANEVFDKAFSYSAMVPKALAASIALLIISGIAIYGFQNLAIKGVLDHYVAELELVDKEEISEGSQIKLAEPEKQIMPKEIVLEKNSVDRSEENKQNNTKEKEGIEDAIELAVTEEQPHVAAKPEIVNSEKIELSVKEISEKPASYKIQKVEKAALLANDKQQDKPISVQPAEIENIEHALQLTSYGKAFKQLFRVWGVSYSSEDVSPCEHALKNQLHCYRATGSMSEVVNLNRPVLLRSKLDRFEPSFIILISVEDKHAIVSQGGDYQLVPISEIESNWDGYFELLWRPLQMGLNYIKPGYKGKAVVLLDQKLAKLQGRQPMQKNPFEYSDDLVAQVRKFQLANQLPIDGVVGPITQMYFNNKNSDTPLLIK